MPKIRAMSSELKSLLRTHRIAQRQLSVILSKLIKTKSSIQIRSLRSQAQRLLLRLQADTVRWVEESVEEFVRGADDRAKALLRALGVDTDSMPEGTLNTIKSRHARRTLRYFDTALLSLQVLVAQAAQADPEHLDIQFPKIRKKVLKRSQRDLFQALTEEETKKVTEEVEKKVEENPVTIEATNSEDYDFPMDYYAVMVGHNLQMAVLAAVIVARALEGGLDLVQVTNIPSAAGDYCDAYKGRVFSLTGVTPGVPLLESTPNGGPPFHPWCRHEIVPVLSTNDLTVPKNLLLQSGETNQNRISREWRSLKRSKR